MIKLKDILHELLAEASIDVLYHFTGLYQMISILKSNKFKLSDNDLTPTYDVKKYPYYLSMTRTANLEPWINTGAYVRLELDGRRLSSNYKIIPYDYWFSHHKLFAPDKEYKSPRTKSVDTSAKNDEMEERLLSRTREITGVTSYIKAVDILILKNVYTEIEISNAYTILGYCYKKDIETYIFNDTKSFKAKNRSAAVKLNHDVLTAGAERL